MPLLDKPLFVDNKSDNTLSNAIKNYFRYLDERLENSPGLDISTAYFNLGGYLSIADELDRAKKLRLLIGVEPLKKDRNERKEPGHKIKKKYDKEKIEKFREILIDGKIDTTIRQERGVEIEAACGQLKREGENYGI